MEVLVIVVLAVAAVVFFGLWMSGSKSKNACTSALEQAQSELERAGNDFSELKKKVQALSERAALVDFPADSSFQLLAKGEVMIAGDMQTFGVVRDESGHDITFLTRQDCSHLEANDAFTAVRGQLAKLGAGGFVPKPVAVPADDIDDSTIPITDAPGGADIDATLPSHAFSAAAAAPVAEPEDFDDEDDEDDDEDMDRTVMFTPDRNAPKKKDASAGLPYLDVIEGSDQGKQFPLHFDSSTIGREQGNTIPLSDTGSSRTHCIIDYAGTAFRLRDNKSTNGTLCNGEKIAEKMLEFGDKVKVADTTMVFTCKGYALKDTDPAQAIAAFEETLERGEDFVAVLKNLAFLLERNIARQKEAQPMWERIMKLDK